MKFSETGVSEGREEFYQAVFDYFAEEPNIWLRALVVTDELGQWPDVNTQRNARYFAKYKYVLESGLGEDTDSAAIFIPKLNNNPRNADLELKLKTITSYVERSEPPLSNLAQLAGVFAGAIRADKLGKPSKSGEPLLRHLKTMLDASDLTLLSSEKVTVGSANI